MKFLILGNIFPYVAHKVATNLSWPEVDNWDTNISVHLFKYPDTYLWDIEYVTELFDFVYRCHNKFQTQTLCLNLFDRWFIFGPGQQH